MPPMRFIRLERESTGSWMTYRLPYGFDSGVDLEEWVAKHLPGWEWVSGCHINPDKLAEEESGVSLGEPDEDIIGPLQGE